ncbi:MAG: hypothetical protein KatS3mg110_0529 [Pirellulaceae bacterium]|nr:MAG: hypothetical protein KatS3mg110_0529 [Pirellulaceae bacterium]
MVPAHKHRACRSLLVLAAATLVGCQAGHHPFSGTGTTRVPPPPTGSFGRADPYYQPPSLPATTPSNPTGPPSPSVPSGTSGSTWYNSSSSSAGVPGATQDRQASETGRVAVGGQTRQPTSAGYRVSEPLRWVEPYEELPGTSRRRATTVIAPPTELRDAAPSAGGRTVIRLSYEEPDGDTGYQILPPKPPHRSPPQPEDPQSWSSRPLVRLPQSASPDSRGLVLP